MGLLYFYSDRVINRWNQQAVGASSINAFKGCLSKIRETRMGFFHGLIRQALGLPGGFSGR